MITGIAGTNRPGGRMRWVADLEALSGWSGFADRRKDFLILSDDYTQTESRT